MLLSQTSPVGTELFSLGKRFFWSQKFEYQLATWVETLSNFLKSTLSSLFMVTTAGHSYLQGLQSPETIEGIGFYALDLISFQVTEEKYHICSVKP